MSDSTLRAPETSFEAWQDYVRRQIAAMQRMGVNHGFQQSWMLRKGIRVGMSDSELRSLYHGVTPGLNFAANRSEALRYAALDGRLNETVLTLAEISANSDRVESDEELIACMVCYALGGYFDEADRCGTKLAERSPRMRIRGFGRMYIQVVCLLRALAIETPDTHDDNVAIALDDLDDAQMAEMALAARATFLKVIREDDADNHLQLIGDIDLTAQGGSTTDARPMNSVYVDPQQANFFYADLWQQLRVRYSVFVFIGSGAYGTVVSASSRADNTRVAIKFMRLIGPLGEEGTRIIEHQKRELDMHRRLQAALAARVVYFPWLLDWTRGRIDLRQMALTLQRERDARKDKLPPPGVGIYQVLVMSAFDFTLYAWIDAVRTVAPVGHEARPVFVRHFYALFAVLLAQLYLINNVADMIHGDIKNNNVLIVDALPDRPLISMRDDEAARAYFGGVLEVPPEATGHYAITFSDFGMSTSDGERRSLSDVHYLFETIPDWPELVPMREALARVVRTVDDETTISHMFRAVPELSAFIRP